MVCKMITEKLLKTEARRFREAILKVNESGGFSVDSFHKDRMDGFPNDCCDDVSDLFSEYLFKKYEECSDKVTGSYYDLMLKKDCYHTWLEIDELIIDLTGYQFLSNPSIENKCTDIFVGRKGIFHSQFNECYREKSWGIQSLNDACWERMYRNFNMIQQNMKDT